MSPAVRTPWKLRIACLAAVVLSTTVALGAMELLLRSFGGPTHYEYARPPRPAGLPKIKGMFALSRANQRGVFKGHLYRTNSRGHRGREYGRKPAGSFRILVAGDSVTMGSGVAEESMYTTLLEDRLKAQSKDYEVINMGLGGANLTFTARRIQRQMRHYDPDLIVYGFTLNDIEGPDYVKTAERKRPWPTYGFASVRALQNAWWTIRALLPWDTTTYPGELRYNYLSNPPARKAFVKGLDDLAAMGRRQDVCVVVFLHTRLDNLSPLLHPHTRLYEEVDALATERGLLVVPSFEQLSGRDAEALWVNQIDSHPGKRAHALLADALAEGLAALPERCWHGSPLD